MPPKKKLSQEEEVKVNTIVERKWRYACMAEDHAAIVRNQGNDVYVRAYHEAVQFINSKPKYNGNSMYPPRGSNVEVFYEAFEPTLTAKAQTATEHMIIALMALSLMTATGPCEYVYLSQKAQHEVDIRLTKKQHEHYFQQQAAKSQTAATQSGPRPFSVQELPILRGLTENEQAHLTRITDNQASQFLTDFPTLHHKILWDNDGEMTYKVVSANYSMTSPSIESYKVQLEGCSSAVTLSSEEFRKMLVGSSVISN